MDTQRFYVPQPHFSEWVIDRRQELDLSPLDFKNKILEKLSLRTLRYLQGGEKNRFDEYTLRALADVLEIDFPGLLLKIDELIKIPATSKIRSNEKIPNSKVGVTKKQESYRRRTKASIIISVALITMLLTVFWPGATNIHKATLTEDGKGLKLWGKNAEMLQIIDIGSEILEPVLVNAPNQTFAIVGVSEINNYLNNTGYLYCFDKDGELIWEFNTFDSLLFTPPGNGSNGHTTPFRSGSLVIRHMGKGNFFGRHNKEYLWALALDPMYAPSRLVIIDPESGKAVYTFWNPGRINFVETCDLNEDGSYEFIMSGSNNRFTDNICQSLDIENYGFNIRTFLLLEPEYGGTFRGPYMHIGDYKVGSIKWLVVGHPYWGGQYFRVEKRGNSKGKEALIMSSDFSFFYYLSYNGTSKEPFIGDNWMMKHGKNLPPPIIKFSFPNDSCQVELIPEIAGPLSLIYNKDEERIFKEIAKSFGNDY